MPCPCPLLSGAARDEAMAARAAAWNDYKAARAKAAALAERDTAYKEAWGYEAAAAQLVAAYVETYATESRDVAATLQKAAPV